MRPSLAMLALFALTAPALALDGKDVVDVAAEAGSFKTLVAAVRAAGLDETLKGPGPFTVLAPTDEAFAKLPPGTLEDLLKPENKEKLAAILKYHVLPARGLAVDVAKLKGKGVKTVEGSFVAIKVTAGKVTFNDAGIVKADMPASNGLIHAIDTVIMPPAKK